MIMKEIQERHECVPTDKKLYPVRVKSAREYTAKLAGGDRANKTNKSPLKWTVTMGTRCYESSPALSSTYEVITKQEHYQCQCEGKHWMTGRIRTPCHSANATIVVAHRGISRHAYHGRMAIKHIKLSYISKNCNREKWHRYIQHG